MEMRRQVLPDGVHNERSISYHTIVLQDLLETWWLARQTGVTVPEDVQPTLISMLQFLSDTRTPDGAWPMVNDSVPDYPINPESMLIAGTRIFGEKEWLAGAGDGREQRVLVGLRMAFVFPMPVMLCCMAMPKATSASTLAPWDPSPCPVTAMRTL